MKRLAEREGLARPEGTGLRLLAERVTVKASSEGAVARLVGEGSALETLSALYEDALRYQPHLSSNGQPAEPHLKRSDRQRKIDGMFYTPLPVAEQLVGEALAPIRHRRPLTILDPAMGTGVFLLAAVRHLASHHSSSLPAESCIFGVDRDPLAVEIAIAALWLDVGLDPTRLTAQLVCSDLLQSQSPWEDRHFDALVGNPPWGAALSRPERARARARFPHLQGEAIDSFKIFLALGAALTRGTIGMIVPQAVLAQTGHADVRRLLLERFDPYFATTLPATAFPGAAAPACMLVFGPRPGPRLLRSIGVAANRWDSSRFALVGERALQLLARLRRAHPSLGDLGDFYRIRDTGINYNRAGVARRCLYDGRQPHDGRDHPRFRGRNFDRYTSVTPGGWLRHDSELRIEPGETLSLDWNTYFVSEKIVVRQTADRIVATLDRSRMVMGRSAIAIVAHGGASLGALLACLNSRLLNALYVALAGEQGRLLPQVKVARLKALPVPAVAARPPARSDEHIAPDVEQQIWTNLHRLAEQLCAAEGRDAVAIVEIDRLVNQLFGLESDEMNWLNAGEHCAKRAD